MKLSTRSRKGLKLLLIIGLLTILFLLANPKQMSLRNKMLILLSKYRSLLPYISAQAQHETNGYTSQVYLADHNLFGMKWINGARGQDASKGSAAPEGDFYAHYASDTDSVLDLLKWFSYTNFPVTVNDANEYASELRRRGYFSDSLANYATALLRWLQL